MTVANPAGAGLGTFILPIAFLVIFYFFVIRPQKKREKEITEMRDNLKVGDEVVTIGGIYGKIIKLKEDIVILETGSDKTIINLTRWSIGTITSKK